MNTYKRQITLLGGEKTVDRRNPQFSLPPDVQYSYPIQCIRSPLTSKLCKTLASYSSHSFHLTVTFSGS